MYDSVVLHLAPYPVSETTPYAPKPPLKALVLHIVVTGHPGISKSTFLFYLLLYRLERKLPTAVQLDDVNYFIFDEQGAAVHPVTFEDWRLKKCWALTDGDVNVQGPCENFQTLAQLVIRVEKMDKGGDGSCIISDLPSVPEIAAIAKEFRKRQIQLKIQRPYDPSSTLSLVRKWGPSTRNIFRSMNCAAVGKNDPIEMEASAAAEHMEKSIDYLRDIRRQAYGAK